MRVVLALFAILLLAGSAGAADIARGPAVVEGQYTPHQNVLNRGDALVVSIIQATFTDLGPTWQGALGNADLIYDPNGSYPDLSPYTLILVDTSDMWWTYTFTGDEAVWTSFHDAGNCVWVVGQDYLYSRGFWTGFPQTVLGLASVVEDVANNSTLIDWAGSAGGIVDGMVGTISACFASNGFYTDNVTPATIGVADWTDEFGMGGQAGCQAVDAGLSTLEFGCGPDVGAVAAAIRTYCGGTTPTNNASWGQIKQMFH